MFGQLVADGDRTTTGGVVLAYSSTFNEEGKAYAKKENKATCGTCKGAWPIYGTASDWLDDGEPLVKDMDRVLCPCGKNFVRASINSNAFYSDATNTAPVAEPAAGNAMHWIGFHFSDEGNCAGLQCVAHFADGSKEYGTLDARGRVRFERAGNGNACTRIELLIGDNPAVPGSVAESILSALAS